MPLNVMMELTWRCGAGCSFCYLGRTGRLNKVGREMTASEIKAFMCRFPRGTGFYFTGGEPFLRRDIFSILSCASEMGLLWGVNTGALPLDAAKVKRLMGLRPSYVIFSLHGPAAVHDRITGRKGSHGKLLSALSAAVKYRRPGTEVMTNCVVNPSNVSLLPAVYLESARAGADRAVFEHLQFLKPEEAAGLDMPGIMTPVMEGMRLEVKKLLGSIGKIRALKGAFGTHFELRPEFTEKQLEKYYNGRMRPSGACPGLMSTVNVEPDGTVRTCVLYCGKVSEIRRFDAAALKKAKRWLVTGGLPPGCARCCHRFPIQRIF